MLSGRGVFGRLAVLGALVLSGGPAALVAAEAGEAKALAGEVRKAGGVAAGLCVHLGCGDGALTAELAGPGRLLVHGLEADGAKAAQARKHIQALGLYGRVSVDGCDYRLLPYVDNLVNLIVAEDLPGLLAAGLPVQEVARVLAPGGVALLGKADEGPVKARLAEAGLKVVGPAGPWTRLTKPRPAGMDEWTHNQIHGPDGLPVSRDVLVKPPARNLHWIAGPIWPIGRDRKSGLRGIVSAGGRNFYLTTQDPANFTTPESNRDKALLLVARDAFNGVLAWKRPASGILVATEKQVFTLLEPGGALTALDAATGEVMTTYSQARSPGRVLHENGRLVVSAGGRLMAIDPAGGKTLWEIGGGGEFVIGDGQVFHTVGRGGLAAVDLATGKQRWLRPSGFKGYLFCYSDGVVLSSGGAGDDKGTLICAYSAKDGGDLWAHTNAYRASFQISVVQGLVWAVHAPGPKGVYGGFAFVGRDLHTGKVVRQFDFKGHEGSLTNVGCARSMATVNYLLGGNPVSFLDPGTGEYWFQWAARNGCGAGQIAANGMVYSLPKSCGCFPTMLRGYTGFATDADPLAPPADAPERLVKGPAYSNNPQSAIGNPQSNDWPTFRHDAARSGVAGGALPAELKVRWEAAVDTQPAGGLAAEWAADPVTTGDRLSAPVVAGGTVFLALPQAHRVAALDAEGGKQRWSFTAGGRIDTPPTIHDGLCLFGSCDGWVYCLLAETGELVWKYRAAPIDRRIVAFGQVESSWPVTGGVVVDAGVACFNAGRSGVVDGGLLAFALAPRTGKVIWSVRSEPRSLKGNPLVLDGTGGLSDLPVSDGKVLGLAQWRLDIQTGKTLQRTNVQGLSAGYRILDRSWHYTSHDQFGKHEHSQHYGPGYGVLVVRGEGLAYAFVIRNERDVRYHPELQAFKGYKVPPAWTVALPAGMQVEALARAGEVLFAAGAVDRLDRGKGGVLWAVSTADGRRLAEHPLAAPPVAEGLAIAAGRLYLATEDGKVLCWGK